MRAAWSFHHVRFERSRMIPTALCRAVPTGALFRSVSGVRTNSSGLRLGDFESALRRISAAVRAPPSSPNPGWALLAHSAPRGAEQARPRSGGSKPRLRRSGYGWLQVKCRRCETEASIPLQHVRRPRDTPKLEAALKCRSCRTPRYSPPAHMTRLTEERQTVPYVLVYRLIPGFV